MKISRLKQGWFLWFLFVVVILAPASLRAAPGDQYWDSRFGVPGPTNSTLALTAQNGTLYLGGYNNSSNTPLNFWDGYQWETIGTFSNGTIMATIYTATFVGNTLYVGGLFTSVNGVPANNLAAWNGSTWSSVGFNGSGVVVTLASSGNNLYAGGEFTGLDSGGITMTNVGYWDGSAWHAMGGGLGIPGSQVDKLLVNGSSVYAGGSFTGSGSITVSNLAVWNGSTWQPVGSGINGIVEGLAYSGGNLYAGGTFTTPQPEIAQWNGTSWSGLGTGMNGAIESLAILNNQVCAAGSFTSAGGIACTNFAIWNGSTWSPAGAGLSAVGVRTYSTGTNVYVCGTFATAGTTYVNGLASWDGTQWNPIGTPGRTNGVSFVVYTMGNDGNNIYAGGLFLNAGLVTANYVARFDGQKWNSMGTGVGPASASPSVHAIAATNGNVYVGGSFSTAGNISAANIAQWDGSNWHSMGGGPGGQVYSIAVQPSGVYVAGSAYGTSGYNDPFFEVWNGTSWNTAFNLNPTNNYFGYLINSPAPGMDAIAFMGTNVFVGGSFYCTTITPPQSSWGIMRSDGIYTYPVGSGFNSNVVALAVINTNLYAAGNFTNAGGYAASHIAMWNGINWTNLGSGVVGSGSVLSLGTLGNYLFAGGNFTNVGGVPVNGIAEWDGTNWYALGSGVSFTGNGAVSGMTSIGSDLYVGGEFHFAGGKPSYFVGHWNNQENFNTPQLSNPVKESTGQVGMTLSGINGLTNIIQATTNFISWTPVFTNTLGIYNYTDSASTSYPYRFYRAAQGP